MLPTIGVQLVGHKMNRMICYIRLDLVDHDCSNAREVRANETHKAERLKNNGHRTTFILPTTDLPASRKQKTTSLNMSTTCFKPFPVEPKAWHMRCSPMPPVQALQGPHTLSDDSKSRRPSHQDWPFPGVCPQTRPTKGIAAFKRTIYIYGILVKLHFVCHTM
jgi:hypothetical protein